MSTSPFTLDTFHSKVTDLLKDNLLLFTGLTITDVSIDSKLGESRSNYYNGSGGSKNVRTSILISNDIIEEFHRSNPDSGANAKYDIVIGSVFYTRFNSIVIVASSIKETGVSDRELTNRRLITYCKDNNLLPRVQTPLPGVIQKVLAITSSGSTIKDDIVENIGFVNSDSVTTVYCKESHVIAKEINDAAEVDIIVLSRGGHIDDAMGMFSHELIIDAIVRSDIPVAIALGHDIDRPFIYSFNDLDSPTPSGFAKQVKEHNRLNFERKNILGKSLKGLFDLFVSSMESSSHKRQSLIENITFSHFSLKQEKLKAVTGSIKDSIDSINRNTLNGLTHRGIKFSSTLGVILSSFENKGSSLHSSIEITSNNSASIRFELLKQFSLKMDNSTSQYHQSRKGFTDTISHRLSNNLNKYSGSKRNLFSSKDIEILNHLGMLFSSRQNRNNTLVASIERLSAEAHNRVKNNDSIKSFKAKTYIAIVILVIAVALLAIFISLR